VSVVGKDQLRVIREQVEKGQKADAIILPKSELDRIRAQSKVQSSEQAA
jgi:hypothetical protein